MKYYGIDSTELDGGTDLDRLHAVSSMENPGRGAGRTFAACHTVAGVLESTEESGVVCMVPQYDRVTDIMRTMVFRVFPNHGINFHRTCDRNQFAFFLPGKIIKYVRFIAEADEKSLMGNRWPMVEFTEYNNGRGADDWKNRVLL